MFSAHAPDSGAQTGKKYTARRTNIILAHIAADALRGADAIKDAHAVCREHYEKYVRYDMLFIDAFILFFFHLPFCPCHHFAARQCCMLQRYARHERVLRHA